MDPRLTILFFLLFSMVSRAQFGSNKSQFEALSEMTTVAAEEPFQVALKITHPQGYHSYYQFPGSAGRALQVNWELPEGFSASEVTFPTPHLNKTQQEGRTTLSYGYEGEVIFLFAITPPADLPKEISLKGNANWLVCNDTGCLPESSSFTIALKAGDSPTPNSSTASTFEKARAHYPKSSAGWTFSTEDAEDEVFLTVKPPAGIQMQPPFYYYSADGQIDAQAEQESEINEEDIRLFLTLNQGNEALGTSAVPRGKSLPGIFTYHDAQGKEHAIKVGEGSFKAPETTATKKASAEEIAEGLALYEAAGEPNVVDLDGKVEKTQSLFTTLGLVFIGGLLLNLMPCVFPVLGLKVMGFVSLAGEDESKIKNHGLVFGLGVLVTMWILASVIISLGLNWGEQLSNPIFLGAIIILLFLMGLNLFGIFEFGTSMTSVGGDLQAKKGYSGSFFSGALTTLIATPCSGPFLGVVMGIALSASKPIALLIFTVFAIGISSPYILLSFFPALIKKLPRPGAWMESFKQVMSFLVFATVVFFLKSFHKLVGDVHFNLFLFALTAIALGVYIYGRWGTFMTPVGKRRIVGYGLAGLFTFGGMLWAYSTARPPVKHQLVWQEWFPGSLELSRSKKRIVWVDYTADW